MKLNTTLINKRMSEVERKVKRGMTMENFEETEGVTPEESIKEAKEVLGIKDSDLIILSYDQILKGNYKKLDAFRNVVNLISNLDDGSEEEIKALHSIKSKLESFVTSTYNLELEDLYEEGE